MSRVLITGASGFLGRALVRVARAAGAELVAVSRGAGDPEWSEDPGITHMRVDLGADGAQQALVQSLVGVASVIHAAASFSGDAQAHARDTVAATDHLVTALEAGGSTVRLILVSSLSVYDVAALDDNSTLDEAIRVVETAAQRDAYAAAKVAQEARVRRYQGSKQTIRPGAIYGPGRLWSAQLGFAKGGIVICPGGDTRIPAIHVDRVAAALVRAATTGQGTDVVNLIDPDPPTQTEWGEALGLRAVQVPRGLVLLAGSLLGRGPAWQARFRPLQYDLSKAASLLDRETQRPFAEAMAELKHLEEGSPS